MTDGDARDAADSLWRYALAAYGAEGVSGLCLDLQDSHGLDVPMLLFALWAGTRGGLSAPSLERAERVAEDWSRETVRPLRAVRRALKAGPPASWPPTGPDASAVEAYRERVKGVEVAAERLLLDALAAIAAADPPGGERLDGRALCERHRLRRGASAAAQADLAELARRAAAATAP